MGWMTEGLQRQKWDRSGIKSRQAEYKIRNILIKRNESLRSLNWQVLNVIFNFKKTQNKTTKNQQPTNTKSKPHTEQNPHQIHVPPQIHWTHNTKYYQNVLTSIQQKPFSVTSSKDTALPNILPGKYCLKAYIIDEACGHLQAPVSPERERAFYTG